MAQGLAHKRPLTDHAAAPLTLLERGTEWAATGAVTIPVPRDFPAGDKTSIR